MKQYFDFSGRARRKEYWMFFLVNILIAIVVGFVLGVISVITGNKSIQSYAQLYTLIVFIPGIAVAVRRAHDSNHRGWWLFVPIYNLILMCFDSDPANNRFGPNPKAST
jgi:uncharacterized membrane protein YhaH (DUF805 family)